MNKNNLDSIQKVPQIDNAIIRITDFIIFYK